MNSLARNWLKAPEGHWLRPGDAGYDEAWLREQLDLAPAAWQGRLRQRHAELARHSEFAANTWLRRTTQGMRGLLLPISATDDDICSKADDLAAQCLRLAGAVTDGSLLARHAAAERFCTARGITPPGLLPALRGTPIPLACIVVFCGLPALREALEAEAAPALARMQDGRWWRRQLRARHARLVERHAIGLGYVHARGEKYASDVACRRRRQQQRHAARTLAAMEMVNEDGEVFSLAELAERSNAHPRIRRSELMTRIAGFEAVARSLGHAAEFVTLTAPGHFHAQGGHNPAFTGASPREAQAWLCQTWQRFRAWAGRHGIRFYGFRVAEPHQDGCPHWHLLLFMAPQHVARFRAGLRRYAIRLEPALQPPAPPTLAVLRRARGEQGMTRGAGPAARAQLARLRHTHAVALRRLENAQLDRKRHACRFVRVEMDGTRSAAGYIAKYVSKNIDGYQLQGDLYGQDAVSGAARIEAWAATHGIRQFQQIGGAPVGVWRELRRLRTPQPEAGPLLEAARAAADKGAWAAYIGLQGGPTAPRSAQTLTLARTAAGERWDGARQCTQPAQPGRYGELPGPAVFGVRERSSGHALVTRLHNWTLHRRPWRSSRAEMQQTGGLANISGRPATPHAALMPQEACPSRTCVNNCTACAETSGAIPLQQAGKVYREAATTVIPADGDGLPARSARSATGKSPGVPPAGFRHTRGAGAGRITVHPV